MKGLLLVTYFYQILNRFFLLIYQLFYFDFIIISLKKKCKYQHFTISHVSIKLSIEIYIYIYG